VTNTEEQNGWESTRTSVWRGADGDAPPAPARDAPRVRRVCYFTRAPTSRAPEIRRASGEPLHTPGAGRHCCRHGKGRDAPCYPAHGRCLQGNCHAWQSHPPPLVRTSLSQHGTVASPGLPIDIDRARRARTACLAVHMNVFPVSRTRRAPRHAIQRSRSVWNSR
jgi:hypothetical protein